MNWIKDAIKGIAIGAGAILPGVSSGVLCVIFGIYEKLLDSVINILKNFKENIKFLLPIVIGGIIGVLIFSNILNYLFLEYPIQINSIFIGLILGTIPSLIKEINSKEKFRFGNLLFTLIAFFIGVVTVILENRVQVVSAESVNYIYLVLAGIVMSVGVIVPGVSSTIILMLMGVYPIYLQSVSSLYLPILIPMGIGLVLGSIVIMKITKKLIDNYYGKTFYAIVGFTLGSVFVLMPQLDSLGELILSLMCIVLGVYVSRIFETNKY